MELAQRAKVWTSATVYSTLRSLESDGLVRGEYRPGSPLRGGRPMRVYRLTEAGRWAVEASTACGQRVAHAVGA